MCKEISLRDAARMFRVVGPNSATLNKRIAGIVRRKEVAEEQRMMPDNIREGISEFPPGSPERYADLVAYYSVAKHFEESPFSV